MRKILMLLFLTSFFIQKSIGQDYLPKVTPPSPEATQLAKFVDMPVSLYNGTPNINIPIYTINTGGIELPIYLSYHAKGIQVSEIASRVGLGWVLNAGGLITRQIRSIPDDLPNGYLTKNYIQDFSNNASIRLGLYSDDYNKMFDYYPDVFYYNFLGYSGKFVFDQMTKQPLLQKYDDIKIIRHQINGNVFGAFTIITPDGTRFLFNESENSFSNNYKYTNDSTGYMTLENSPISNNSWYLTTIITTNGEEISFQYQTETTANYDISEIGASSPKYINYNKRICYQKQLKRISYPNGKIEFNSLYEREDLWGSKSLDNIEIYNKIGTSYNTIKKFKLNHFYTNSNDDNQQTVLNILKIIDFATQSKKRLFLSSVEELSISNINTNEKLITSFEYNPEPLPNRFSNAKDNWGYYNGKNNYYLNVFYGADRTVDTLKSEAGMLKKIIHPTGGYTKFIYETNRVIPPTFFKNLLIPSNNPFTINKSVAMLKDPTLYDTQSATYIKSFEVTSRSTLNFTIMFDTTGCNTGVDSPDCRYNIALLNEDNIVINPLLHVNTNHQIDLLPGIYKISVKPKGLHHPGVFIEDEEFAVSATWHEQELLDNTELYGAGKRIKKIIKGEGNNILLENEYYYTDEDGKCSGVPFSIPPYFDIMLKVGNAYCVGHQIMGDSAPLSEFSGNNLGYSSVTEIQKGNNEIIKKTSEFTIFQNEGEYYKFPYHIPVDLEWARGLLLNTKYFKYNNNAFLLLKKIENNYMYYGNCASPDGNILSCFVNETNNAALPDYYVSSNRFMIPSYKFGKYWNGITPQCPPDDFSCYRVTFFKGGKLELKYTKEYNYFDNNQTLVSQVNYKYDNLLNYQKTSQTTTSSTGETLETKYYYPQDLEMQYEPNVATLIEKNIVGVPLKTITNRIKTDGSTVKLSEQLTKYGSFPSSTAGQPMLLPQYILANKGEQTPEQKITYQYDTHGNITQYTPENGVPVSIIWGYNHTLPVAKIENIAYSAITPSLIIAIQSATDATTGYSEANVLTSLANLRTALAASNTMITTYTHKPLVGVSTITDPKGDKITYEYDNFNRLKAVKDKNGNTLSENEYHYKP